MSREQLEFWRELLAPFPQEALSVKNVGGRELTYIDKRSLANRLDSVVGPDGWHAEYRDAGGRGLICRLHICVPTRHGWEWKWKEDGGSDEEMTKKQGGQQIKDVDNSFKSELTNAFRRAAQDAWGIGRYLYQKGIPLFLDPSISAEAICGEQRIPVSETAYIPVPSDPASPASSAVPDRTSVAAPAPVEQIDIPAADRDVFGWANAMEKRFRTGLVNGMKAGAKARNLNPEQMYLWPQDSVNAICREAIAHIKTLGTYRGEFEHIADEVAAPSPAPTPSAPAPPNTGDPLAPRKLELMTKIGSHIERQLGQKPGNEALKAAFQTIAAECQTSSGHVGEVPDSLKGLTDGVWLQNMIRLVDENIRRASEVPAEAPPELPF